MRIWTSGNIGSTGSRRLGDFIGPWIVLALAGGE